ncbi:unnamed protein product [Darwinula stevensoni]|uniref:Ubiquitin-like domain-containing protein n=1 Tax=Darwinula stevensoni TaxID=69355 RepID=A0A7R8XA64_9CRUS|nr:unnamed protein product [Darwinula stevensoni]CAG0883388.1 unnamed protein product [Darwinula stevensoni]
MATLPEAVNLKYGPPTIDSVEQNCRVEIFVPLKYSSIPRPSSVLILNSCNIEKAGNDSEIDEVCREIKELDLAENKLVDWTEILKILNHAQCLTFLNLSYNDLSREIPSNLVPRLQLLSKLVLIGTNINWPNVHTLLTGLAFQNLEELHLSLNNLSEVQDAGQRYPTIRIVHFNGNPVSNPKDIHLLGKMFPGLQSLVLADCPVRGLGDDEEFRSCFPVLEKLNLNNSMIPSWEEIEKLRGLPSLVDFRMVNCPAFEEYTEHERRQEMIARLDNVHRLNGGAVSRLEREDAERAFIRAHLGKEEHLLPPRYHELVVIHGQLNPLAEVDLSPKTEVTVNISHERGSTMQTISVYITVLELKQLVEKVTGIPVMRQRVFYVDQDMVNAHGPEEMRFHQKKLYRYNVESGDSFIIQDKKSC